MTHFLKLSLAIWMFAFTFHASAQNQDKQFDAVLQGLYKPSEPGAAALVAKDGKIIYHKGFGMGNLEYNIPMSPNMVFEIGSISKQFTAVCILMLAEQGKLSLTDDITKYLPDFPTGGQPITIHQMLTHTSGLNSYTNSPTWRPIWRNDYTPLEFIETFKSQEMVGKPGEKYVYSNSAYFMLGYIIEKASGISYQKFLEENIFKPVGMDNSFYGSHSRIIKQRAAGYQRADETSFLNAEYLSTTQPYAAGSIMSTVEDLLKWNEALHSGKLIKSESLKAALTNYNTTDGKKINYGYGWMISSVNGTPCVEHGGSIFGFLSYALYVPSEKVFVAVLSNRDDINPEDPSARLASIAINKPYADAGQSVKVSEDKLKALIGVYEFEDKSVRYITYEKGEMYSQREGGGKFKLVPLSEKRFAYENSLSYIELDGKTALFNNRTDTSKGTKSDKALPEEKVTIEVDPATLAQYVGDYELQPGFSLVVTTSEGKLFGQATGQPQVELFAEAADKFFLKVVVAQVVFHRNAEGKVEALTLFQGGQEMKAPKK